MRIQKERANAKINLYLDVVSLRDDGFHDIKSIMHTVSLCDEISVKYIPSKLSLLTFGIILLNVPLNNIFNITVSITSL